MGHIEVEYCNLVWQFLRLNWVKTKKGNGIPLTADRGVSVVVHPILHEVKVGVPALQEEDPVGTDLQRRGDLKLQNSGVNVLKRKQKERNI